MAVKGKRNGIAHSTLRSTSLNFSSKNCREPGHVANCASTVLTMVLHLIWYKNLGPQRWAWEHKICYMEYGQFQFHWKIMWSSRGTL